MKKCNDDRSAAIEEIFGLNNPNKLATYECIDLHGHQSWEAKKVMEKVIRMVSTLLHDDELPYN